MTTKKLALLISSGGQYGKTHASELFLAGHKYYLPTLLSAGVVGRDYPVLSPQRIEELALRDWEAPTIRVFLPAWAKRYTWKLL